jgi:tight adherence protein C
MDRSLMLIPGGVGDLLRAITAAGPWVVFLNIAGAPFLVVRAARRKRIAEIEEDLPLFLDLLATLAEAGLSFDAALARILDSQPSGRALVSEFRTYQRELLAGLPRLRCLRLLPRRMGVNSMTIFVSALVHAEQVGASIAETLRRQAQDLRDRRRAQALMMAQALPVKLVFPLILCFLPGIFVSTLGPALFQMVNVVNSVLRTR